MEFDNLSRTYRLSENDKDLLERDPLPRLPDVLPESYSRYLIERAQESLNTRYGEAATSTFFTALFSQRRSDIDIVQYIFKVAENVELEVQKAAEQLASDAMDYLSQND